MMDREQARAILAAAEAFTREDGDRLWAALLALEDADEFVRVATRLDWQFHPRGFDNTELHERYRDGILPWLATRVDDTGALRNTPWCVVPCLLACGSAEAFALVWRVRTIDGRTPWGGAGPDGDLVSAWRTRHPDVAREALHALAPTDARARAYLRAAGEGDEPLALLDACARGLLATRVRLVPPERADVRVVAARHDSDWGIACEWIEGTRPSGVRAARVQTIAYGSRVRGIVDGVAVTSRPPADLASSDLDGRLGPPTLALEALGLEGGTITAAIPHVGPAAVPSESPVWCALVAALRLGRS
jgi:hypothetical protein